MRNIYLLLICACLFACSKETLQSDSGSPANGTGGSLTRFTLSGEHLYLVESSTLKTYQVTNPANPVLTDSIVVDEGIETIYPYKNNLFIGSQNAMYIYSTTNPAKPVLLGTALHVRSCDPVVANDTAAFVTLRSGTLCGAPQEGLYVYDIKMLQQPQLKKIVNIAQPYGLGLSDSTLFVCSGTDGLKVLNISNAWDPQIFNTITGYQFFDVIPFGNLLICYVSDGLAIYDISNVRQISFIKKIDNQ